MVENSQQKNIFKTVIITIIVMLVILVLFLNKITTPRYLSDVELKINGLQLLEDSPLVASTNTSWQLVAANSQQQQVLSEFVLQLKDRIRRNTQVTNLSEFSNLSLDNFYPVQEAIGIINPEGQLIAYIKAPFDQQKMILTYSSLITHR